MTGMDVNVTLLKWLVVWLLMMCMMTTTSASIKELGSGPMRFAPTSERSFQEQLDSLAPNERECFDELKRKWEREHPNEPLIDAMILRFARCSPGMHMFNAKTAWNVMQQFDRRYLTLKAVDMEEQLLSQTMFPVPNLKHKNGNLDVFYMGPNRNKPDQSLVDNLVYCMKVMVEKEAACTKGIAIVANMCNWKLENFSIRYCYKFVQIVQGSFPVRVRVFLIVNPPGWTSVAWSILKSMLPGELHNNVIMIRHDRLHEYFPPGYERYMPDEIECGQADTAALVQDFVTYRKHVEA